MIEYVVHRLWADKELWIYGLKHCRFCFELPARTSDGIGIEIEYKSGILFSSLEDLTLYKLLKAGQEKEYDYMKVADLETGLTQELIGQIIEEEGYKVF